MKNTLTTALVLALSCWQLCIAQEKWPAKGQAPKPEDFAVTAPNGDTTVHAIELSRLGKLYYEGNTKGWLNHVTQVRRRIKILHAAATDEGNVTVELRNNPGDFNEGTTLLEEVSQISGYTWQLENGVVKEFKMDKSAVMKDKSDKREDVVRFSLPNVKPGSIIEINYTLNSPFPSLVRPWFFQGAHPILYSSFEAQLPTPYQYTVVRRGRHPFAEQEQKNGFVSYTIAGVGNNGSVNNYEMNSGCVNYRFTARNLAGVQAEDYVSSYRNHMLTLYFQLAQLNWNGQVRSYNNTWPATANFLYNHPQFGAATRNNVNFYESVVAEAKAAGKTDEEKAAYLFNYVQRQFNCTDFSEVYALRPLRQVWQAQAGSVAEINLLLSSMLEAAGLKAAPAISATRAYGLPFDDNPVLQQYNYVMAAVELGGQWRLMDAAQKIHPMGELPAYLYNGQAHVMLNGNAVHLSLDPDAISSPRMSMAFLSITPQGQLQADYQATYGSAESGALRNELFGETAEQTTRRLQAKLAGTDQQLTALQVEGKTALNEPLKLSYTITQPGLQQSDLILLNPIVGEGFKVNPFRQPQRGYPVEMNYPMNYTYTANIELPAGFVVDELPKNVKLDYNGGEGFFDYMVVKGATGLKFRYRLQMKKAVFAPEEYEQLRSFFGEVVKKQQEMIVLKKQG